MSILARWLRHEGGAAAVELALIAPVFAAVLAGIATYAPELEAAHKMRSAVSTASLYTMTGGSDATAIQSVAYNAWPGHSGQDQVSVTKWCTCSGATSVCTTACADNTVPWGYTQISASTVYVGPFGNRTLTAQQIVRTR